MKKLLYIGHAYHNKTKSTAFLKEMFARDYDIETFDFDPYQDDMESHFKTLEGKKFDVVVIFQIMSSLDNLKKYISFDYCAFFPMYDGALPRDNPFWYQYRDVNIINFSRTLHNELKALGFSSYYFQFFPRPINITNIGDEKSVFFWQRINQININTVGKLIDLKYLNHIHMHHAIDPGHNFVEPPTYIADKTTHSTWFDTREDMQKQMQKSAIYIAPRYLEGIGMSFLEAMAMGRCVIAPNYPTMNEYITNGVNGILYDLNNPLPIDLSAVRDIQERTKKYIETGYENWEKQKWKIVDILTTKPKVCKSLLIKKYVNNYEIDNMYSLFGFLPLMRVIGNMWHKTYKLLGLFPVLLIKGREANKRVYLFGIPVLKTKQICDDKGSNQKSLQPPEISLHLQDTKNPKGRVLVVFHMNFLRKDCGCSNYMYENVKVLKKQGYAIDFFSADLFGLKAFDDLVDLNNKERLIDNFYFSNYKNSKRYKKSDDVNAMDINWVNDFTREFFNKIVIKNNYDYIYIHYIQWANLLSDKQKLFPTTVAIYNCQDTNFNQKFLNTTGDLKTKANIVSETFCSEYQSFGLFDKIVCISYDEMLFWQKFFPDKEFYFFPHPLEEIKYDKCVKDIDLLYLAAHNPYNLHGLQWFVDKVYPFIKEKINITICGRLVQFLRQDNPDYIRKLKNYGFNLIDFANDLDKLYSRVKVVMVPLYEGTGMKIKTVEAMSHNIPIVSRLPGVDGFPDKTNNGILVTDDPKEFADNIMRLLTDKSFYTDVKNKEHEYFDTRFAKKHIEDVIKKAFNIKK